MNRRHLALLSFGYLGLVFLTPLRQLVPQVVPFPDVGLLVVLYAAAAVKGSPSAGATVAVVLGYMADLATGAPKGLSSLTFGAAYFIVRALGTRVYLGRSGSQIAVSLLLAAAVALSQALLVAATAPYGLWFLVKAASASAAATAATAPVVLGLLRRLDRWVAPEVILEGGLR